MIKGQEEISPSNRTKRPKFFYGYIIVAAALCISVVMWGARHSFGVFFEPVLDEFGWTRALTSGGFSISWILTGLLSIGVGRLNDRFGPRRIMTVAGILLCLGYLLTSRLNALWQLYLFYGVISIGMSAALVPLLSTVARWFVKMRALMTGIVLASTGIALMVLLPAASQITSVYGWRISYIMIGALALVVIVPAAQFLKRDPYQMGQLPYGSNEISPIDSQAKVEGLSFREALYTGQLWLLSGVYFCTYFLYYILIVHMVIYATGQGISPTNAVAIMAFIGGGGIAGRVLMGMVADRAGSKLSMVTSSILMVIALLWLLVAKDPWMLYLFGAVFGFGHGGLATMESPMVAEIFGMRVHGVLLGFVFFADTIGGATGPVLAGLIFDVTNSYNLAFLLCAVIGVVDLILVLLLRPVRGLPGNK